MSDWIWPELVKKLQFPLPSSLFGTSFLGFFSFAFVPSSLPFTPVAFTPSSLLDPHPPAPPSQALRPGHTVAYLSRKMKKQMYHSEEFVLLDWRFNKTTKAESSSKRRRLAKENDDTGTDRMSSLPDSLLLHILSFLPTKTSVAKMCLVSRRWRHLWEHLQVFDFDDNSYYRDLIKFKRFAFFVNAVLALRRSRDIRKMRLHCGISDEDSFRADSAQTWVRAATGPRLEELHLTIKGDAFVLRPHNLLNCTNLVSLSLCGAIRVIVNVQHSSAAVHFPSLKMLQLDIHYVDSLDALLSGCPILETLNILEAPDSMSKFRVPPSLKRLKFTKYYSENGTYLEIDVPGLQYLSITAAGSRFNAAVSNLQNVVEAYLDVFPQSESDSVKPLINLLQALSGTKHLVLCCLTTKWLLCAPVLDFPEFCYLLQLKLILPCFHANLLVKVLEKCHVLQVLTIESNKEPLPLRTWVPHSTRVPNCLVSHLTNIHIKRYQGLEDELTFAEYILRNGLVLKSMIIKDEILFDPKKRCCIIKRLFGIRRGSARCALGFD